MGNPYYDHLRGKVRVLEPSFRVSESTGFWSTSWRYTAPVLEWAIVNETTGEAVHTDNSCASVSEAMEAARQNVEIARHAHCMGIGSRSLRKARS